jgi:type IV pilus biogenesis/stability protein PilW
MWIKTPLRRLSVVLGSMLVLAGCASQPEQNAKMKDPIYLYQMGVAQFNQGHFTEAEKYFQDSIRFNGTNPSVWNSLGLAYLLSGRLAEARQSFEKTVQIQPSFADAHNNLGVTFLQQGELAAAEREFNLAKQDTVYSQLASLWLNLGLVAMRKGADGEATAYFGEAITRNKDYALAYLNRSKAYMKQEHGDEAVTDLRRYLELRPDDPEGLYELGRLLASRRETAEARKLLEKVWLVAPSSTWGVDAKKLLDLMIR